MKISRSSYYDWLYRPLSKRARQDIDLTNRIIPIFKEGRNNYGARRIKHKLFLQNIVVSQRRISRLMRLAGLTCKTKRKFKATSDSNHKKPVALNILSRNFNVSNPNRSWVGDITYIKTNQGWLYLAVVIDLYSRQVVGWSMSNRINAELVDNAILMAIWKRKPEKDLVWHTDRGRQYASDSHRKILKDHKIIQSMSRKGDCWDNAVSESFFHTLKTELTNHYNFENREEAKKIIFEYIEVFYNRKILILLIGLSLFLKKVVTTMVQDG